MVIWISKPYESESEESPFAMYVPKEGEIKMLLQVGDIDYYVAVDTTETNRHYLSPEEMRKQDGFLKKGNPFITDNEGKEYIKARFIRKEILFKLGIDADNCDGLAFPITHHLGGSVSN